MKRIEVKLVQDTPMWHFQGASEDCCLRATEVKPKLDRFLIAKIKSGEVSGICLESIPDSWWVNKDKKALNYKMRIVKKAVERLKEDNGRGRSLYPLYFGKMGKEAPRNMRLVMFSDVKLEIIIPIEEPEKKIEASDVTLGETITANLPQFFANTSFGTRQDKGFGCFRVTEIGGRQILERQWIPQFASYCFRIPKGGDDQHDFRELFQHINYFHKVIRSGVNEPGCYVKSMMYHYARFKRDSWDKPIIRTNFQYFNPIYKYICGEIESYDELLRQDMDECNVDAREYMGRPLRENRPQLRMMNYEYQNSADIIESKNLYRDALGLATSQDWRIYHNDRITITLQPKNSEVMFKSPIDYHPICSDRNEYVVYIILHEIPDEMKAARFTITDTNGDADDLTDMRIAESFSVFEYFEFIRNNYQEHIRIPQGQENRVPFRYINRILGRQGTFRALNR